jgi:RNA polymerase sigma-70 factor (ECF subfamily)
MAGTAQRIAKAQGRPESELVAAARTRDETAIRELVRRNNQRLFRVARAVLRDDAEAEDVVQETYVKAFTKLDGFEGKAAFSTWLTRIALNEALGRRRKRKPTVDIDTFEETGALLIAFPGTELPPDPENATARHELGALIGQLVDQLPDPFRLVFVLREVEELSTEEVAEELGIKPATVKTRLFRARKLLREGMEARVAKGFASLYPFDGARCTRLADRVVAQLAL